MHETTSQHPLAPVSPVRARARELEKTQQAGLWPSKKLTSLEGVLQFYLFYQNQAGSSITLHLLYAYVKIAYDLLLDIDAAQLSRTRSHVLRLIAETDQMLLFWGPSTLSRLEEVQTLHPIVFPTPASQHLVCLHTGGACEDKDAFQMGRLWAISELCSW